MPILVYYEYRAILPDQGLVTDGIDARSIEELDNDILTEYEVLIGDMVEFHRVEIALVIHDDEVKNRTEKVVSRRTTRLCSRNNKLMWL